MKPPLLTALVAVFSLSGSLAFADTAPGNACVAVSQFEADVKRAFPDMQVQALSDNEGKTLAAYIDKAAGTETLTGDLALTAAFTAHDGTPLIALVIFDKGCLSYMEFMTPALWAGAKVLIFGQEM